ncbi:universal stress protein [Spelaeicoccus albus]|uniref:Nucleotide-binding universal stress UspA family protein n=1 Tax=Spelaeicoccus albus TaxID=1280376 RepID=A0A7Z0AA14_9MICO|nr:universal stress protein [Spelaeicoccus albus]NYI66346.1 nucleotide-binding universal stress UspA family protein [Spelaeicoccus albus]
MSETNEPVGDATMFGADNVIVVGVSTTSHSAEALRWAAEAAERLGSKLVAVRAWRKPHSPTSPPSGRPPATQYEPEKAYREAHDRLLADVAEVLGSDHAAECLVVRGNPLTVLLAQSENARLLVLDAPQRTDLTQTPLLAHRLVYRATCPVVVMPPRLVRRRETPLVRGGKKLAQRMAESAATAGRPGIRPPSSRG